MALIPCPECKHKMSSAAPACPRCGRPLRPGEGKTAAARQDKTNQWGCLFVFIGFLLFVGWSSLKDQPENLNPSSATPIAAPPTPASTPYGLLLTGSGVAQAIRDHLRVAAHDYDSLQYVRVFEPKPAGDETYTQIVQMRMKNVLGAYVNTTIRYTYNAYGVSSQEVIE